MVSKNTIYRFLLIAFLLPYAAWGIVLLAQELGWFQYGTTISVLLVTFGANCPAIAAYLALKKSAPNFKLKQYLKDAFGFKQKVSYYAITLLFVVIFFGVPALMGGIATQLAPFSGGTETQAPMPIWLTLIASPLFFFLGGSEELGWRYFLQPALEQRMKFVPATIITAFIWCIWHLPLFLITGTSQNSSSLLSFALFIIGAAFASAAIYRVSKSAWLVILFHCITNSLQGSLPLVDDPLIKGVTTLVLVIASLVVVFLCDREQKNDIPIEKAATERS